MPGLKLNLGAVQANEPSPEKPVAIAPTPREEIVAKLKQQEAEEAVARLEESNRFALAGKLEQVRSELVVGVARAAKREARRAYTAANETQNEELAAATKSAMAEMARLTRLQAAEDFDREVVAENLRLRAAEDELHEIQHETSRLSDDTQLLRRRFVKTREALQTTTEALHVGELDMKDYFFMPASRVVPGSQLDALPLVAAESERIAALARRGATQNPPRRRSSLICVSPSQRRQRDAAIDRLGADVKMLVQHPEEALLAIVAVGVAEHAERRAAHRGHERLHEPLVLVGIVQQVRAEHHVEAGVGVGPNLLIQHRLGVGGRPTELPRDNALADGIDLDVRAQPIERVRRRVGKVDVDRRVGHDDARRRRRHAERDSEGAGARAELEDAQRRI